MTNWIARYAEWLHTRWPAGGVEKLPEVGANGETSVAGLRIVGDLTGIPLLKFSLDTGARAARAVVAELRDGSAKTSAGPGAGPARPAAAGESSAKTSAEEIDLAIVGAGVSGMAAAMEARAAGLRYRIYESTQTFSTLVNFPKAKPIYTYPTEMRPEGRLSVSANVKEALIEELERQHREHGIEVTSAHVERVERMPEGFRLHLGGGKTTRARRVIVAIGRTGNYRKLGVPGEQLDKVYNRLYDPRDHAGKNVLVVGGGDSALETSIALVSAGAHVTHSYRKQEFARPKPENAEQVRRLVTEPMAPVRVEQPGSDRVNPAVGPFSMARDETKGTSGTSGAHGAGATGSTDGTDGTTRSNRTPGSLRLELGSQVREIRQESVRLALADGRDELVANDVVLTMIGREAPLDFFRRSGVRLRGELGPRSWMALGAFTLAILLVYLWKGWFLGHTDLLAIRGSAPPTSLAGVLLRATANPGFWFTLAYSTCIVAFGVARIRRRRTPYVTAQTLTLMAIQVIPLFLLPEIVLPWLDANGWLAAAVRDHLFPDGQYWRAYGFVLAWPLFLPNLLMGEPLWWWVGIGVAQTFVLIPLLVRRWGKGAYCGWICSCGALAETMGDTHRQKMWHGPRANRVNMTGQVILLAAIVLTLVAVLGWVPGLHDALAPIVKTGETTYKIVVDVLIGGAIGLGFYFWFSGRVWCRFACPLAALMHIYARFSRFRIFADKKKCISCNVCTSVCHQGIDIMNFANKGLPMQDPECVRCSACVQSCPTGVLQFGRVGADGAPVHDKLAASPVLMREVRVTRIVNGVRG